MSLEYDLFVKLLDDEMINFNALLIKNYKKLGISEKDIIVLSCLERQQSKGNNIFNPTKIKQKIALSQEDLFKSLTNLTGKGYVDIRIEFNYKTEKDTEVFSLDNLYESIVNLYLNESKKTSEKKKESFQEEISNFYEESFKRQMNPIDVDIIRRWSEEKEFSLSQIKNAMLEALKLGKTSLKYVDQMLIKEKLIKEQSPEYKEANEVIDALKNVWKK